MIANSRKTSGRKVSTSAVLVLLAVLALWGCKGDTGSPGPVGAAGAPGDSTPPGPLETTLTRFDGLPGLKVEIVSLSVGSGAGGNLVPGDTVSVRFTVATDGGRAVSPTDLDRAEILLSGPTGNYQPVLPLQADVALGATSNGDGSYTYTFPVAIPAAYPAPANDSAAFDAGDGELQGQALLDGTYTVALMLAKRYWVEGTPVFDVGTATADVLLGAATVPAPREVVSDATCGRCHQRVRYHGTREGVRTCVLCHTAGAEDRNDPAIAGGTPGRSIAFGVMIHKLHNGAHLPSVLGVGTGAAGDRDYTVAPLPYRLVDANGAVHDYSTLRYPVWPNGLVPLPVDAGWAALTSPQKQQEDEIRTGVATCAVCHGDPDGSGPLAAPAEGDHAYTAPTRAACGSCHDDIDWTLPYTANGATMTGQLDDTGCTGCHAVSGDSLAVKDGHRHPLRDAALNPGLVVSITSLSDAGAADGDGVLDPGEKVQVTFTVQNDTGAPLTPDRLNLVLSGPAGNPNSLLQAMLVAAELPATQPYVLLLPETIALEYGTTATAGTDSFATQRPGHWDTASHPTTVYELSVSSGPLASTTLASAASTGRNLLDVTDSVLFSGGDTVRVDSGPGTEYAQVATAEGNRLWLTSPLKLDHAAGVAVERFGRTQLTAGVDYSFDAVTGTVQEIGASFTDGDAILVTYTSDFLVPNVYQPPPNDTPDLGPAQGDWTGLVVQPGTYRLTIGASRFFSVPTPAGTTQYRSAGADTADADVLSPAGVPWTSDVTEARCEVCHMEVRFHGGGAYGGGLGACLACHTLRGMEDTSLATAASQSLPWPVPAATPGVSLDFRRLLHKLHRGRALAKADSYRVVGYFSVSLGYADVAYPASPGGTKQCTTCHDPASTAWRDTPEWSHPEAAVPATPWTQACTSCHDTDAALAHAELNTYGGVETCSVCHGPGSEEAAEVMHRVR